MQGRPGKGVILLLLCMALTGCWDRQEIEERASVLAVGADACAAGEECRLRITWQFPIHGQIPLGPNRGRAAETTYILSQAALDDPQAQGKAQAELNRALHFGHLRVFVVAEAVARRGLLDYIDWLRGVTQSSPLQWIVVAEGNAGDVIRARPILDPVPALYLDDMLGDAARRGAIPEIRFAQFKIQLSNRGEEAVAPVLRMKDGRPALSGLAVFRGYSMVGKLSPVETATFMHLRGRGRGLDILPVMLAEGQRADLRVERSRTRYHLRWDGERLHVQIRVQLEGTVAQSSPTLNSSDAEVTRRIEEQAEAMVRERAEALMRKLQTEFRTDILAVGERVRAYLPSVWRSGEDWPAIFARTQFTFDVDVAVRRTGMAID